MEENSKGLPLEKTNGIIADKPGYIEQSFGKPTEPSKNCQVNVSVPQRINNRNH